MADPIKKLEDKYKAVHEEIEEVEPKYLENPELWKVKYERLNEQLKIVEGSLCRALENQAGK